MGEALGDRIEARKPRPASRPCLRPPAHSAGRSAGQKAGVNSNPDTDTARPVYDGETAARIFKVFKERNLLDGEGVDGQPLIMDSSGEPAYTMKLDVEGWDKAIADGRPLYPSVRSKSQQFQELGVTLTNT
jgi:hypothetical protein